LEEKESEAKRLQDICGSGWWEICNGEPAEGDARGKELKECWQAGQLHKLRVHSSGTFSIKLDTNKDDSQKDAAANYAKALDDLDKAIMEFNERMKMKAEKAGILKEVDIPRLEEEEKDAETELGKMVDNVDESLQAFSRKRPVEYAQIKMLFEVSENIGKVGEWMLRLMQPASAVSLLMKDLKDEEDPSTLIEIAEKLIEILSHPEKSPVAFMMNITADGLAQIMQPKRAAIEEDVKHPEEDVGVPAYSDEEWEKIMKEEMKALQESIE